MEGLMDSAFTAAGLDLVVRNHAMGGTPSVPYSFCLRNHLGADADVVAWEFFMIDTDIGSNRYHPKELFIRNALALPNHPPVNLVFADFPRR
jgi:hypothetical protein